MILCRRCLPRIAAIGLACIATATPARAQIPPETNLYELLDPGASSTRVPDCGCVATPFALPTYRPEMRGGDPARLLEERASLPYVADDALTGNGHASLAVAMHLREERLFGTKAVTEEEVVRWLNLAASQDHPDAFMLLGYRFQRGLGVPQDDRAAAYWFYQGAVRGESVAMVAIGLRYATGTGVPQDFAAAVRWWQRAQGVPLAARLLGDAYACGLGVERNLEVARRSYQRAVDHGDISASIQLGHLCGDGCLSDNDAAIAAYRRAADEGYPEAQIALSDLLRLGGAMPANAPESYFWARMAERRLPDGALKNRARDLAASAARLMSADVTAAQDVLVEAMIAATKRPQ